MLTEVRVAAGAPRMIGERTATRSGGLVATGKATLGVVEVKVPIIFDASFLMLGGSQRVVELAGASGIFVQVAGAVLVHAEATSETGLSLGQRRSSPFREAHFLISLGTGFRLFRRVAVLRRIVRGLLRRRMSALDGCEVIALRGDQVQEVLASHTSTKQRKIRASKQRLSTSCRRTWGPSTSNP